MDQTLKNVRWRDAHLTSGMLQDMHDGSGIPKPDTLRYLMKQATMELDYWSGGHYSTQGHEMFILYKCERARILQDMYEQLLSTKNKEMQKETVRIAVSKIENLM